MRQLATRIFRLLRPGERRTGIRVSVSVFINALLDFAGLASLLPVLYFLLDGSGNKDAALSFCLIAVGVCLVKYVVATRLLHYQNVYLLGLYKRLSFELYSSYFRRGLLFIRKQGVSRLGYEINAVCYAFSQSILAPLLRMAGDSILILMILVAMFIYSPATALVLLVSFIPFALIYALVIRKKAKQCGEREQKAKREQARVVHDTFGGYAELQVNDAFPRYSRQFLEGMDEIADSRLKMDTVQRLPLFLSEVAVVTGLTCLTAFGVGDVRILVGVFAVAAFRLLPAVRSVLSGWTVMKNAEYCLEIIEQGLVTEPEAEAEGLDFNESIDFEGISYSYPEGGTVFCDFNLKIAKGEYVGFRGNSGAGKSTLFNLLLGFLVPDSGCILIDGKQLKADKKWLGRVGYVPQEVFIFTASLGENIALGTELDRDRAMDILNALNLSEWFESLPEGLDTQLGERGGRLSGGQRQRIGMARALYRNAEVLLLDEATSALDNDTEKDVLDTVVNLRKSNPELTILSIAHRDSSLANCDRIIEI